MKDAFTALILIFLLSLTEASFGMNHIIVQGHEDPEAIKKSVAYYANYWKIDGMSIVVIFTHQMARSLKGYVKYEEDSALQTKTAIIKISLNQRGISQKITLAHEMIHLKQYYYGELISHDVNTYTWKNQSFKHVHKSPYQSRPWEKEAFKLEKEVFLRYQNQSTPIIQ